MSKERLIKEIFSDYNSANNINESKISSIDLYKNTNKLEMSLFSNEYIEIKDIWDFEKYLKNRFNIEYIMINMKYDENTKVKGIKEEWRNITCFMAHKFPITKAILTNSELEINQNQLDIKMQVKGADFLTARGVDKELRNVVKGLFNKEYKINFIEDLEKCEVMNMYEEKSKRTEKLAIEKLMEQNEFVKEVEEEKNNVDTNNVVSKEVKEEIEEEKSPLILGRSLNIKDELTKVQDITVDSGKIALEGEIINIDSRELKNGKFLVLFDLYDGTSTITCKSFVEANKAKQVIDRIKSAKGVKIAGTAQFDPYAKELGVISNVIVETAGRKKVTRKDLAEVKRVELHMHTQMSQMDGMTSAKDLIKRAMSWGMKSIAITDHGVVQAFPEAHKLLR